MKSFYAILALCVFSCASSFNLFDPIVLQEWLRFKNDFGKVYSSSSEEVMRMNIFDESRNKILEHNRLFKLGQKSSTMKMNKFGDMLNEEVSSTKFLDLPQQGNGEQQFWMSFVGDDTDVPDEMDWRTKNVITPVKDQKNCGSCWAFAATGAVESHTAIKTGKLVSLSEQNLIDCSLSYGTHGCQGSGTIAAYNYIKKTKGIDTEESYPYEEKDSLKCRYNPSNVGATVSGFVQIPYKNETALKIAVGQKGPVGVGIDITTSDFRFYNNGVINDPTCTEEHVGHAVIVVGYGYDKSLDLDYWLIKNQYGASWGEDGYVRLARNKNNQCGIASVASYPLV